jgi:copper transport protein
MARRVGRSAAVVAAIAYLLSVGLGGAEMVLGGPGAFFTADAWAKGVASTLTPSAAIGVPAMLLLAWAFGGNGSAPRAGALAVGAAAAIGSFLVTGHAATAPPVWLMATVVGVHLACTAFWFGALPPLLFSARTESPAQAGALMTRFSHFAVWAVAAIFASGVVVSWVQLAGPANLFGNDYGLTLGIKVLLVLAVVGIAAFNRRVLTPALERGDATAAARIRGTIRTEVALFVLILGAAMALTLATPPRALVAQSAASAAGAAFRTTVEAQGYRADIEVSPARAGENMVMATFRDAGGAVLSTVVSVEAVAALESAGISDVRVRAEAMPDGMWHVILSDMVIPGPWTLDLETFVTDYDKVIFSTTVEIR